jgi:hypothetical protein
MTFSDETLMAYADGELDAPTRAALEAAMAQDPQLGQRIARHRALRARLQAAFEPVLAEPLPERLLASAGNAAPTRRGQVLELRRPPPRWSWPQWAAIAASLVLGAVLAPLLWRAPTGASIVNRDGQMLAGGALAQALNGQLAASPPGASPVQIGVSFRARGGEYCRTFVLRERSALAGLACRERSDWRLLALAQAEVPPAGARGYRPAASTLPPAVARAMDDLIEGEPLDARGEAAARARGWAQ